jgi:hypothetical protein
MRKGQSEAIGLLVIVILLVFIGFLYLRFGLSGKPDTLNDARQNIEANGLLRALLLLEMENFSFQEEVSFCHTTSSCEDLKGVVEQVLSTSLRADMTYMFSLFAENQPLLTIGDCNLGIMSRVPFTVDGVFYEASLRLCS